VRSFKVPLVFSRLSAPSLLSSLITSDSPPLHG
jgi:hypothetical protein